MRKTIAVLAVALSGAACQVDASSLGANNGILPVTLTAGQFKTVGIPFARPVEDFGTITTTGTNIVDSAAGWTVNQWQDTTASDNRFDVEITSGRFIGARFAISSNTATQLTVSGTVPLLDSGTTFVIRKAWTLAGLFGVNNSAGLTGSGALSSATQVRLLNSDTGAFATYFYNTDAPYWADSGDNDASFTRIPNDAFLVLQPAAAGNVTFQVSGEYRGTRALTSAGGASGNRFTMVPNPSPFDATLETSGMRNTASVDDAAQSVLGAGALASADNVRVLLGGAFSSFYFNTDAPYWADSLDNDASSQSFAAGSSILFVRRNAGGFQLAVNPISND